MGREERAVGLVERIERRGLRFGLDSDLIVVLMSAAIDPEECRTLVEQLGEDEGTPEQPGIVGVLLPYVRSVLKGRQGVEVSAIDCTGKAAFSPEFGWGTVVDRDCSDRTLTFTLAEHTRNLRLFPKDVVVVISDEQRSATPNSKIESSPEAKPNPNLLWRIVNLLR